MMMMLFMMLLDADDGEKSYDALLYLFQSAYPSKRDTSLHHRYAPGSLTTSTESIRCYP